MSEIEQTRSAMAADLIWLTRNVSMTREEYEAWLWGGRPDVMPTGALPYLAQLSVLAEDFITGPLGEFLGVNVESFVQGAVPLDHIEKTLHTLLRQHLDIMVAKRGGPERGSYGRHLGL